MCYVNKYAIKRAQGMVRPLEHNPIKGPNRRRVLEEYFIVEYGFIRSRFFIRSTPVLFPHQWFGEEKYFHMPPTLINSKVVSYAYTEFSINVYKHNESVKYKPEESALTKAMFLLDGSSPLRSSSVANVINSKIISLN